MEKRHFRIFGFIRCQQRISSAGSRNWVRAGGGRKSAKEIEEVDGSLR